MYSLARFACEPDEHKIHFVTKTQWHEPSVEHDTQSVMENATYLVAGDGG